MGSARAGRALALLIVVTGLTACGQKGPLTLPAPAAAVPSNAASAPSR